MKVNLQGKSEGGLGIKELEQWNEVLMTKHLWNVASKKRYNLGKMDS